MGSSWCESSPVKAVAGGPVASVAIRRVTGGCEAYTARKQAVMNSAPKSSIVAMPTPLTRRKAASGQPLLRGWFGVAGVSSTGHVSKGISREPRRAPCLCRILGVGPAQPKLDQVPGDEGTPCGKQTNPRRAKTCCQGRPEAAVTGRRAVLRTHITDEGGEPQGSRKGRPRYPLEGRGEQVDASAQSHIAETQNSEAYVKWN
jgi:hypothetical protein